MIINIIFLNISQPKRMLCVLFFENPKHIFKLMGKKKKKFAKNIPFLYLPV